MAKRVVWMYPTTHPEMPRSIHLTTARQKQEDPNIGLAAHAFEEWDIEVPKTEPAIDEKGLPIFDIEGENEDGSPRHVGRRIPSAHPDGISTTHESKAICGITRISWVNPQVAAADHDKCIACQAALGV